MAALEVADIPTQPTELEDCAAALFQATGYYVDCNVVQKDSSQILELDVVATRYDGGKPSSLIAEAKTGDWGYPDLFKVVGWMTYLKLQQAAFFFLRSPQGKNLPQVQANIAPLGVNLIHLDSPDIIKTFADAGFPAVADAASLEVWRFSFAIQRALVEHLRKGGKAAGLQGTLAAWRYHRLVNDEIFFEPDLRKRLSALYAAFAEHPRLSLGVAREIERKPYDCTTADPTNATIRQSLYSGQHDLVQACFYLEHRARLAVLKTAVDLCLLEPPPKVLLSFKGTPVFTDDSFLPGSFRTALRQLRTHKYFHRYAVFWQVFLWGFGGFWLKDRQDQEFQWLSEHTGIPATEIPNALTAFDVLFPTSGGWIADLGPSNAKCVKMVPMALQGIGSYRRKIKYGVESYADLGYADHTADDLARWNNKGYETLKLLAGMKDVLEQPAAAAAAPSPAPPAP